MIWYSLFFLIKWWWIIFVIIVISPYIDWIGIKFVVVVVFSLSLEYERPIDERNETKRTNETDFSNIYLRIFSIWFFVFSFIVVVVSWNSSIFMYLRGCCFSVFVFLFVSFSFPPCYCCGNFFFFFASSFSFIFEYNSSTNMSSLVFRSDR